MRRHYSDVEARYGHLRGTAQDYAVAETEMWWVFTLASEELARTQAKRDGGRGRRPSPAALEKLRRRQGVAFTSFDAAGRRLEELATKNKNGHRADPLAHVLHQLGARRP